MAKSNVSLYEQIIAIYPELTDSPLFLKEIVLQNDSDGKGDWIQEWNYSKPIPDGFKLGK